MAGYLHQATCATVTEKSKLTNDLLVQVIEIEVSEVITGDSWSWSGYEASRWLVHPVLH